MQYEVSNATATRFVEEFYRQLARPKPVAVDKAVQLARQKVADEIGHERPDFATPVLFMSVEDGHIRTLESEESLETRVYRELVKLDYAEQDWHFEQWVKKAPRIGAILVSGPKTSAPRWLLNRLAHFEPPKCETTDDPFRYDLAQLSDRSDIDYLWRQFATWANFTGTAPTPEAVVQHLARDKWSSQNVFLVFNNVDELGLSLVKDLLDGFWRPLAAEAEKHAEQTFPYWLVLFLRDNAGTVPGWPDLGLAQEVDEAWKPALPLALSLPTTIGEEQLKDWMLRCELVKTRYGNLADVKRKARQIYVDSREGRPARVLNELCQDLGHFQYNEEGGSPWLKL
jgi:hypothetical protein